jgi:hypothetical protein
MTSKKDHATGTLIELPYRHFKRTVIEKLISAGYLLRSRRHRIEAVSDAWERLRAHSKKFFEERQP